MQFPQKILVIRFSSMGDIVMFTPVFRVIKKKFPNAKIDFVVRRDFLDLVEHNPHIHKIWTLGREEGFSGLKELLKKLNQEGYDVVYDGHRSLRSLWMMWFLKVPTKLYFSKHYFFRSLALTFKLPLWGDSKRFLEKYVEPLKKIGVEYDGLGPEVMGWTNQVLPAEVEGFFKASQGVVGLIPSAQWEGKRWPESKFRDWLIEWLRVSDDSIIVFGGKGDSFCHEIAQGLDSKRVLDMHGKLSLLQSALVLKKCRFVVANDTGLMHLADAVGVPSVLIFGPTSIELGCAPFHPQTEIVEKEMWCRPCSKNGQAICIRSERKCLTSITVSDVVNAALRLSKKAAV